MRREHKLDVQVADRLEEFAGSDSARYKARKRLLARTGLRLRVGPERVVDRWQTARRRLGRARRERWRRDPRGCDNEDS